MASGSTALWPVSGFDPFLRRDDIPWCGHADSVYLFTRRGTCGGGFYLSATETELANRHLFEAPHLHLAGGCPEAGSAISSTALGCPLLCGLCHQGKERHPVTLDPLTPAAPPPGPGVHASGLLSTTVQPGPLHPRGSQASVTQHVPWNLEALLPGCPCCTCTFSSGTSAPRPSGPHHPPIPCRPSPPPNLPLLPGAPTSPHHQPSCLPREAGTVLCPDCCTGTPSSFPAATLCSLTVGSPRQAPSRQHGL